MTAVKLPVELRTTSHENSHSTLSIPFPPRCAALDRLIRGLVKVNFDAEVRKVAGGDGDNSVFFVADFAGTATFPEPYYEKRGGEEEPGAATANATDITGEQVRNLLGGWTERAFLADLDVYRQYLRDSTEPILQHHTSLVVDTDPPPYDDGDGDIGQQAGTRASGGDTPLIVALAVVSAATAATLFFVVLPCLRGQRRCPGRPKGRPSLGCVGAGSLFKGQQLGGNCALDADAVLPGRRADGQDETDSSEDDPDAIVETSPASAAALQVLEASDRYLSKHRPDLFDAVKRASLSPSRKSGNSTSVFRDQHHLGDEHNHFGMELEDDFIDDEYYDEVALSDSFVPSSSWWNKLTSSLQAASPRDGSGRDGILVCDEDPSNYNFPFSDFPRTDGSPCLIYNESHTITHSSGNNSVAAGAALTNDQFQHQLEGQGQTDTSVESDDGGENKATEGFYEDDDESDRHLETPFTERLERLVAMRRRHYEKERLMERHRQARRLAEEQEAQRQRELKLRQHEMELDLEEIEASFSPTATANRRKSQLAAGDVGEHPMTVGDLGMFPPEAERESDLKFVGGETLPPIPSPPFISAKPPLSDGGDGSSNRSRRAPAPKKDGRSCNNTGVPVASSLREKGNRPITPVPMKRRRSHRRSSSHGTNLFADEKKTAEGGDHQYAQNHHQQQPIRRQGSFSNVDDAIMTFGIAAYTTKFV